MSIDVADAELLAFERRIQAALASGRADGLTILGYGEVTTCLALETRGGGVACKRITPFPERARAEATADLIRRYVEALAARGVDVIATEVRVVPGPDGGAVLYCLQPSFRPEQLATEHCRRAGEDAALACVRRIFAALAGAVTPEVAPDGQLSNWAVVGERLAYLDVSSPFMRDTEGRELLDWRHYLSGFPAPLRPVVHRWVLPRILGKYYSLRGQLVDFIGNLQKERLESLIAPSIAFANGLGVIPPIDAGEVRTYYAEDARTYAVMQALRRADRWWHRRILRRPYPYFLPPRFDRNL